MVKKKVHQFFRITDEGSISEYLGVNIETLPNDQIKLSQPHPIDKIIEDSVISGNHNRKATPTGSMVLHRDLNQTVYNEEWKYCSVMGKLSFLEKYTRSDLAYTVHQCARIH